MSASSTPLAAGPPRSAGVAFRRQLAINARAAWARAYVRIVAVNRMVGSLVLDIILPVIGVAAYVWLYDAMGAPPAYRSVAVIGGVMTHYWLNMLWGMASQFYWEKEMGNLEIYLAAPISRWAILLGMALGGLFSTTLRMGAVLAVGVLALGAEVAVDRPVLLALAFLFSMSSLYGLGMMASSLFLVFGREAWHMTNLFSEPIFLASGLQFPVKNLGFWPAAFASAIPLTLATDALRQLAIPGGEELGFLAPEVEVAALAAMTVLFVTLAVRCLAWMEARGKREGKLTLRWQ